MFYGSAYSYVNGVNVFSIPWITEKEYKNKINAINCLKYYHKYKANIKNKIKISHKLSVKKYYFKNKEKISILKKQRDIKINHQRYNKNTCNSQMKNIVIGLIAVRNIKHLMKGGSADYDGNIIKKEFSK